MTYLALLLLALGLMALGAAFSAPTAYAYGRRAGRNDLEPDAEEARRILAGWATERAREWPQVEPRRPGGYRGRRRAAPLSWRARLSRWWQATAPSSPHTAVAAAMAGATTPLRDRFAGVAVIRVWPSGSRRRLASDWRRHSGEIPVASIGEAGQLVGAA